MCACTCDERIVRSFVDSLLVLVVLPLAIVKVASPCNWLTSQDFQPLDLLTMIGFVILLGLVVDDAVFLVYQTRHAEASHCVSERDAVRRLWVPLRDHSDGFGMLPLLLVGGAPGCYRGLAAVRWPSAVVALFTLVLPALLRLGETNFGDSAASATMSS